LPVRPAASPARPRQRPLALIVEDDEKTAGWLKLYLERGGYDGLVCSNGLRAMQIADGMAPDVILLDLMLPGVSGFEVCRRLREASRAPIIVITARSAEDDRLRGFECGADDYVTKPFSPREVVARVKAVLRRTREANQDQVVWGGWSLDVGAHEARAGGVLVKLTRVETRLFAAMLKAPRRVFERRELVLHMFGDEYEGTERAVDAHIKNLRKKLDVAPGAASIQTIHGSGYRLVETDGSA
jgi:two-component system alkaline phosphatase synthesis response regulator PhoP